MNTASRLLKFPFAIRFPYTRICPAKRKRATLETDASRNSRMKQMPRVVKEVDRLSVSEWRLFREQCFVFLADFPGALSTEWYSVVVVWKPIYFAKIPSLSQLLCIVVAWAVSSGGSVRCA